MVFSGALRVQSPLAAPSNFLRIFNELTRSRPIDFGGVAKQNRPYAQWKNSHDETTEPVSTDRRLVHSRSCVQTSGGTRSRARPRAEKKWRPGLQGIGVDQARQRSDCAFSRGWTGLAGANQRCAEAGGRLVIRANFQRQYSRRWTRGTARVEHGGQGRVGRGGLGVLMTERIDSPGQTRSKVLMARRSSIAR